MADFEDLKDKKYPDSITEEDTVTEQSIEEKPVEEKPAPAVDPRQFMCVYAGPGYFAQKAEQPFGFPSMMEQAKQAVTEDVYAGPAFPEEPEEESDAPEECSDVVAEAAVQEGKNGREAVDPALLFDPSKMHRNPTPEEVNRPTMMLVYAAPPLPRPGMINVPKDEAAPTPKFCHECGYPLKPEYKFCVMCGTKVLGRPEGTRTC